MKKISLFFIFCAWSLGVFSQQTEIVSNEKYVNLTLPQDSVNNSMLFSELLLKSDSLEKDFKAMLYSYSIEDDLKKINHDLIKIDTIKYKKKQKKIKEFQNQKELSSNDTLEYLKAVIELKHELLGDLKSILSKEMLKPEKERSNKLIEYLHALLVQLDQQIYALKDEINFSQLKIIAQERVIKRNKNFFIFFGFVILFFMIISVIVFRLYHIKKQNNQILQEKNNMINQKNEEIQLQNKNINNQNKRLAYQQTEIMSSISYASTIQTAVLPTKEELDKLFDNYFIVYLPRDVVSGDFYWAYEINETQIIIAADCTGHGVPGAFMSMLGISYLNEIIVGIQGITAADILNKLREKIKYALKQTGDDHEAKDGIDMSVCLLNKNKKQINFAGANNPLFLIRNNQLKFYKADRQPIGINLKERKFTNNFIDYETNDIIYMFSDGFADQFNEEGNKYKKRFFKELLLKISDEPLQKQQELLTEEFQNWKGNYEQTDDVLIIGMKLI